MAIRIDCPSCGRASEFAEFLRGLTVICKGCGQRVTLPAANQPSPPGESMVTSSAIASSLAGSTSPPSTSEAIRPTATAPVPSLAEDIRAGQSGYDLPRPASDAIQPSALAEAHPSQSPEAVRSSLAWTPSYCDDFPNPPSIAMPGWEIDYVVASLRVGLQVPLIEQRLVARGLSQADATAAVNEVLEASVGASPLAERAYSDTLHRALSALVGCVFLAVAGWLGGGSLAAAALVRMLFPLACIWFPGAMSRYTEPYLRLFGWLALIGMTGIWLWINLFVYGLIHLK